ncbi:MAG TPA: PQQ-binding-like beta-propeller repeat protein [Thermoanaerobaculia bacterium]|nr:PQQ-binding-like beta-propeller repeat protein [Thermoanaerobaculia bacterium]
MIRLLLAILILPAIALSLSASVFIDPTFSEPSIAGKSLLVSAPGSERLICLSDAGKVQWQRTVKDLRSFGELDERSFFVQQGRKVSRIESQTGESSPIATLPAGERIDFDPEAGAAWSTDVDWSRRKFVFRDPKSLRAVWRDDRIESVAAIDTDRVFVMTATRQYEEDRAYRISDATLRALDRASGRELWAYRLHDSQALAIRAGVRGERIALLDGAMASRLTLLSIRTGEAIASLESSATGSEGFLHFAWTADDEVAVLEFKGSATPDLLATYSVPDFRMKGSMPLPVRENLFFYREGTVVVTSGIYSLAAFDAMSAKKLWELDHQVLIRRPRNGRLFGSRSDETRNMAVLESIDLATGVETTLYQESLPAPKPPTAAERRARQNAERKRKKEKEERARKEANERPPVGDELCLRYDQSGMLDVRDYLLLHRDGSVELVDADKNSPAIRMSGRWRKLGDATYELTGLPLVRNVEAANLTVPVGVRANLPLLRELRDGIEAFERAHMGQATFTEEELRTLEVREPGCPPEALAYCDFEGKRIVSVSPPLSYPPKPVAADDLDALLHAIDAYLLDGHSAGTLRFRLRDYRSMRYAEWLDPHSFWKHAPRDAEREIDSALESRRFSDATESVEPALFRLDRCSNVATALQRVGPITRIP